MKNSTDNNEKKSVLLDSRLLLLFIITVALLVISTLLYFSKGIYTSEDELYPLLIIFTSGTFAIAFALAKTPINSYRLRAEKKDNEIINDSFSLIYTNFEKDEFDKDQIYSVFEYYSSSLATPITFDEYLKKLQFYSIQLIKNPVDDENLSSYKDFKKAIKDIIDSDKEIPELNVLEPNHQNKIKALYMAMKNNNNISAQEDVKYITLELAKLNNNKREIRKNGWGRIATYAGFIISLVALILSIQAGRSSNKKFDIIIEHFDNLKTATIDTVPVHKSDNTISFDADSIYK